MEESRLTRTVLITGGAGFIGSHLADELLSHGYRVRAIDSLVDQVHEGPALRPGSETVLAPGMVVTIEPGVYLPGWGGIRVEDDVLVTPDGCEVLTSVAKDLASIAW